MIHPETALNQVISAAERRPPRALPLAESLGLRLAQAVVADHDCPPFPRSMMDGYAVRVEDAGQTIQVDGEIVAGGRDTVEVVLRTYDLARALRDAGVPVIGGFHSPMEKECLDLLLRGEQPVVICPARAVHRMRIPSAWQDALKQKRLLIVSPFDEKHRQTTAQLAEQRNRFVAMLAADVFVAHAGPETKTERLCLELLAFAKPLRMIDVQENANLISKGALPFQVHESASLPSDKP